MIFLTSTLHELGEIDLDVDAEFGTSEAPNDFEFATSLSLDFFSQGTYIYVQII